MEERPLEGGGGGAELLSGDLRILGEGLFRLSELLASAGARSAIPWLQDYGVQVVREIGGLVITAANGREVSAGSRRAFLERLVQMESMLADFSIQH